MGKENVATDIVILRRLYSELYYSNCLFSQTPCSREGGLMNGIDYKC